MDLIDCVKHNIDEIRLIRATNESENHFYESFKGVKMLEVPFFIHYLYNPAERSLRVYFCIRTNVFWYNYLDNSNTK